MAKTNNYGLGPRCGIRSKSKKGTEYGLSRPACKARPACAKTKIKKHSTRCKLHGGRKQYQEWRKGNKKSRKK